MRFYTFPKPEIWMDRPQPGGFEDYDSKVASWMVRNAFRYLRETFDLPGLEFPHPSDLASWMIEQAALRGGEWAKRIDVEERATYASREALRMWDGKVYARATKGGSRSRRGPSVTIAAVQTTEGLSIAQAAKELGCSTATVKRRRAEIRSGWTSEDQDILRGMDRASATTSDSGIENEQAPAKEDDDLLALLEVEPEEIPVSEMFRAVFAQYGLTREMIRAQTPDWTTPHSWSHEYEAVSA